MKVFSYLLQSFVCPKWCRLEHFSQAKAKNGDPQLPRRIFTLLNGFSQIPQLTPNDPHDMGGQKATEEGTNREHSDGRQVGF